ncbi:hypothetical protein NMG60_11028873 [Bertholletia excelsa]
MANQQNQPRPWIRLPSIIRPAPRPPLSTTPPALPSPPKPRTPILSPALSQRFAVSPLPPPPPPPAVSPPVATVPRPSPPPPATASPKQSSTSSTPRPPPASALMPSPVASSPNKSPTSPPSPSPSPVPARSTSTTKSPQTKPLTAPPSPTQFKSSVERDTQPPPESEQKTVLVQESTGKTQVEREIKTRENKNHINNPGNSEAFGGRIITVAGENRGAIMELSHSLKKDEFNAEKPKMEHHKLMTAPFKVFVNSNVQGVNNSMLYNCSGTQHDPGVHLSIHKKAGGGVEIKESKNGKEI